jgi:hypothetical protein
MAEHDVTALQTENARLVALLEANGIDWRLPPESLASAEAEASKLSTDQKVVLFRRLFQGRTDVYPIRWDSKTTGKAGYAPACANVARRRPPGDCLWIRIDQYRIY